LLTTSNELSAAMGNSLLLQLVPVGHSAQCRPGVRRRLARAAAGLVSCLPVAGSIRQHGRLPEWPKGAVCKTVGIAYVGSNPTPATLKINRR
jgi:hypothetical protein